MRPKWPKLGYLVQKICTLKKELQLGSIIVTVHCYNLCKEKDPCPENMQTLVSVLWSVLCFQRIPF